MNAAGPEFFAVAVAAISMSTDATLELMPEGTAVTINPHSDYAVLILVVSASTIYGTWHSNEVTFVSSTLTTRFTAFRAHLADRIQDRIHYRIIPRGLQEVPMP